LLFYTNKKTDFKLNLKRNIEMGDCRFIVLSGASDFIPGINLSINSPYLQRYKYIKIRISDYINKNDKKIIKYELYNQLLLKYLKKNTNNRCK